MEPESFPQPKGMPSFWRSPPGKLDCYRSSKGLPETTPIMVIGAGFSGASLVTHLLEYTNCPGSDILVVEARELCSGATGRNGGHLKPDYYNMTSYLASKFGIEAATEVAEFELANLNALQEYVRTAEVDCDFHLTRAVDVQLNSRLNASLKSGYEKLLQAGSEVTKNVFYVEGKEAESISGVKNAKGAFTYTAGHLWPYKLIHHMFARALEKGVSLQTNTRVISISSERDCQGNWSVITDRGVVRAHKIIMATNAYTPALLSEFKDKIIPYRAICSRIITPGKGPLLPNTYALRFNEWDFDYLIPRTDGSIIVGGARQAYYARRNEWYNNVNDGELVKDTAGYFDGYMQRHFRGWESSGAKTDQVWTGIIAYSSDKLPHVGEVPDRKGVFIMGGFSGHGMPQIFLIAQGVAQMVTNDVSYEDTKLPRLFKTSIKRLGDKANSVLDLYDRFLKTKL